MKVIIDNQQVKFCMEHLYCVENYHTISIFVESKGFAGTSNFCIATNRMKELKSSLEAIDSSLAGNVEMKDYDSDAFLKVALFPYGKLEVLGQIGASYNDHYMRFKFQSDQTIIRTIISFFKESLDAT